MWAESAAGGFAKKKVDLENSKPPLKSPEKSKEVSKKESTSNTLGSIKKTVVKLQQIPSKEQQQSTMMQQMQLESNAGPKGSQVPPHRTPI